jgi:hypothetical protein
MGPADIVVLIFVYLACRWIFQLLTARCCNADEEESITIVIYNGHAAVANAWHQPLESSHNGGEPDEKERPKVIEIGDLRIEAHYGVCDGHRLGAGTDLSAL